MTERQMVNVLTIIFFDDIKDSSLNVQHHNIMHNGMLFTYDCISYLKMYIIRTIALAIGLLMYCAKIKGLLYFCLDVCNTDIRRQCFPPLLWEVKETTVLTSFGK